MSARADTFIRNHCGHIESIWAQAFPELMDTNMYDPIAHNTPAPVFQSSRQSPPLGLAGPPSFARALRQRGLIGQIKTAGDWRANEPAGAGKWIAVMSAFEAHLRRQAMEQAFAEMRGDAA